jgi:hypothetical protein
MCVGLDERVGEDATPLGELIAAKPSSAPERSVSSSALDATTTGRLSA